MVLGSVLADRVYCWQRVSPSVSCLVSQYPWSPVLCSVLCDPGRRKRSQYSTGLKDVGGQAAVILA